ncbi:liprin-beta-2-like isoform X1 [Scylla paramamosain]|uniref:liprin-beta-2-like isoform X1 n=1 Tax=Scylla paramamosain TaxID=85552 RepID=UPI003083688A
MSAQLLPPNVEASKMLEAALQQMDGIIAGTQLELASLPDRSMSPSLAVLEAAEKLRQAVQMSQFATYLQDEGEVEEIPEEMRNFLLEWLRGRAGDKDASNRQTY